MSTGKNIQPISRDVTEVSLLNDLPVASGHICPLYESSLLNQYREAVIF
jgi:hypothetical protein